MGSGLFVVGLYCYESVLGVGWTVWGVDCLWLVCIVMNLSWEWVACMGSGLFVVGLCCYESVPGVGGLYGECIVCCWFVLL